MSRIIAQWSASTWQVQGPELNSRYKNGSELVVYVLLPPHSKSFSLLSTINTSAEEAKKKISGKLAKGHHILKQ